MLKRGQQRFLIGLLVFAIALLALVPFVSGDHTSHVMIGKLVGSSGLFLDIAGIIQLEISGAFETLTNKYGNVDQYPYGPPSHITRQIIDNPDTPIRTGLRNILFFEHRTGIWFLIAGFALQLSAVWIWV
jgi:hypothetical protein